MRVPAALLALALAGCAAMSPGTEELSAVDGVIAEAVVAARAPATEQKAALARAHQLYAQAPVPLNRLRVATLLAVLPAPLHDDWRAVELLEPLVDASAPGVGRFAALLATQIADRQRLSRELERAARDAERLGKERERGDRERERVDKERDKREEALRQQLEALRAIEHGILEREERLRKRQR